jgi:hypothetical protein
MKRLWWILRAYLYMNKHAGWARWDICSGLYETYVLNWSGCEPTPADAVSEEMSYWGE